MSFGQPWPWVGAVLAGLIFLPHVLWQVASDWPTLGFVREQAGTDWFFPGAATLTQLIAGGPALALILVAGVLFYFSQAGTRYRLMGWTYLFVLLIFELLRGKFYYPLTMYPVLLAAGAVAIDRWMARRATVLRRRLLIGALGVNLAFAPIVLPVFPYDTLLRHNVPHTPDFDVMVGWPELAETVVEVWHDLPQEERSEAVILTRTYGTAGALDLYGASHGLPPAVSGHNTYYFWGPGDSAWNVVVAVGFPDRRQLDGMFDSVELVGIGPDPFQQLRQDPMVRRSIYICRGPRHAPTELWPQLRLNF